MLSETCVYYCKCMNKKCYDDGSFPWPVRRVMYINYKFNEKIPKNEFKVK